MDLVAAQNDTMALGAREAFKEIEKERARAVAQLAVSRLRWLTENGAILGGQRSANGYGVRSAERRQAVEMLTEAIEDRKTPQPLTLTVAVSIPALDVLRRKKS